jgi:nucleoid-associated protein YgaU
MEMLPKGDRMPGPKELFEVSMSARRRWLEPAESLPEKKAYRPPTLDRVASALNALDPAALGIGASAVPEPGKFKLYQVRKDDTLRALAVRFYGHADDWKRINEANLDKLENPDRIYVGQLLRIPLDEKAPASNTTQPAR